MYRFIINSYTVVKKRWKDKRFAVSFEPRVFSDEFQARSLSQVNLAYVIWKQTDFVLDLCFENLICDLKTWFMIWKHDLWFEN